MGEAMGKEGLGIEVDGLLPVEQHDIRDVGFGQQLGFFELDALELHVERNRRAHLADRGAVFSMLMLLDIGEEHVCKGRVVHGTRGGGEALPARGRGELPLVGALSKVGQGLVNRADALVVGPRRRDLLGRGAARRLRARVGIRACRRIGRCGKPVCCHVRQIRLGRLDLSCRRVVTPLISFLCHRSPFAKPRMSRMHMQASVVQGILAYRLQRFASMAFRRLLAVEHGNEE